MDYLSESIKKGYVVRDGQLEHRLVYRQTFGPIKQNYVIHHLNEIKNDNRPENLIALPAKLHHIIHQEQWNSGRQYNKEYLLTRTDNYLKHQVKGLFKHQKPLPSIVNEYRRMTNRELLLMNGEINRCLRKRLDFSPKYELSTWDMVQLIYATIESREYVSLTSSKI